MANNLGIDFSPLQQLGDRNKQLELAWAKNKLAEDQNAREAERLGFERQLQPFKVSQAKQQVDTGELDLEGARVKRFGGLAKAMLDEPDPAKRQQHLAVLAANPGLKRMYDKYLPPGWENNHDLVAHWTNQVAQGWKDPTQEALVKAQTTHLTGEQGRAESLARLQNELHIELAKAKSQIEVDEILKKAQALGLDMGVGNPARTGAPAPVRPPIIATDPRFPAPAPAVPPAAAPPQQAPAHIAPIRQGASPAPTDPYLQLTRPAITPEQELAERKRRAGYSVLSGDIKGAGKIMSKDEEPKEYQTKDASYAERMARAEITLRGVLGKDNSKYNPGNTAYAIWTPEFTHSEKWRDYQSSAREWIAGMLRKDTGAAVTETEWKLYFPTYFPQPGDSIENQKLKMDRRIQAARGLRSSGGPAFDRMYPNFDAEMTQRLQLQDPETYGVGKSSEQKRLRYNPATGEDRVVAIEVDAPDGAVVEFPDGTPPEVMTEAMRRKYGPHNWTETAADVARQGVGHMSKGLLELPMLPLRAAAWATGTQGKGLEGVAENALSPWLKQPPAETAAGRYAGSAGEAIGGSAIPAGAMMRAASKVPMVAPAAPGLADRFLRPIAEHPSLMTGIDVAAGTGSGVAKQAAEDVGGGRGAQMTASIVGGMATPLAIAGGVRGAEAILNRLPKILASADGSVPTSAVRERAIQMIADRLTQAGVSADELEQRIANLDWARTFHTSGKAPDAMTLADLDETLARMLGSAVRQQPEAANTARGFLYARQTGLEPERPLPRGAGLPVRQPMDRPITGAEAEASAFGTDFGAGQKNLVPMGQHERILDSLRRALRIQDADYHGHAANANRTDEQIIAAGKAASKPAYDDAYAAGYGVDLQPTLAPVLTKWRTIAAGDGDEPQEVQKLLNSLISRFANVRNIQQFDKNKQFGLDARIDKLFESIEGRNRYVGGRLNEFKNDMLNAVDGIAANDVGAKYKNARDVFSSHAESRRVLRMGREAFGEDSDVGVDAFNSLVGRGDQKLFRLGYLGAVEKRSANMLDAADRTKLFDSPRQRTLLAHIIERTETPTGREKIVAGAPAEFADRPQRFGANIGDEKRQIRTRDIVSGNSKTPERLADDEAFDVLHKVVDIFKDTRLLSIGKRGFEYALNKSFGMRADTSAELAQLLLTAEPVRRQAIFDQVRARMGSTRFQRFSQIMSEYQRQSLVGTTGGVTSAMPGEQ